jgi:cytidine deaminase
MHCYICDNMIPAEKIRLHPVTKKTEPCGACMDAITEATHDDGLDHSLDEVCIALDEDVS